MVDCVLNATGARASLPPPHMAGDAAAHHGGGAAPAAVQHAAYFGAMPIAGGEWKLYFDLRREGQRPLWLATDRKHRDDPASSHALTLSELTLTDLTARRPVVEALIHAGFVEHHFAGGQVAFHDGDLQKFSEIAREEAASHGVRLGCVFRLRDPGLGLRLSDEQILRMLGAGELFLPEGVHYRPLRKALRGPGLWGKCRFPIDNDHDEL